MVTREQLGNQFRRTLPVAEHASFLAAAGIGSAVIGTVWWAISFRLALPREAGIYVSAFAASTLAADIGSLGVGYGLIRFLPTHGLARGVIPRAFLVVVVATLAAAGAIAACLSAFGVPPVPEGYMVNAAVVAVVALSVGLSALADNLLLACGREGWLLVRAIITGLARVCVLLVLAFMFPLTAGSLLASFTLPTLATSVVVLVALRDPRLSFATDETSPPLKILSAYTFQSYLATLATVTMERLLPLIVLAHLGPTAVARFGVAWVIGSLAALIPTAVAHSRFAREARFREPSYDSTSAGMLLIAAIQVPASVGALLFAPVVLPLLGDAYADIGPELLAPLLGGVLLAGLTSQVYVRLRLTQGGLVKIVGAQLVQLVLVLGLSTVLLPNLGLPGAAVAWTLGTLAALLFVWRPRRPEYAH